MEKRQRVKTILQRRKQGLLVSRETKDSTEHEIKKKINFGAEPKTSE